jgi:hypothetical protein
MAFDDSRARDHLGHRSAGVPDRLAEDVVEELDLHLVDDRLSTFSEQMSEQLGGWRGGFGYRR